ncbi:uncharacterized protein LOC144573444 [Carex rostrata]
MTRESSNEGTTSPMEIDTVNPSSADEDDLQQSESKRIAEIAQPVSVAALSLTLLVNAPKSIEPKLLFPYNAYFVSLCLSLFTSIGLCMYSLVKSAPNQDLTWFQKRVMIIATGSVLFSVILRLFLELPVTNVGYDGLSFLAIIAAIILYLWYSWRKANSSQTIPSSEINNTTNEEPLNRPPL